MEAFVLAGGKSSRMGRDKGLVRLNEQPMILHVLKELQILGISTKIIANNPAYKKFMLPVYSDVIPKKGPMGGLLTAMENTKAKMVILLACDMPFVTAGAIELLLENANNRQIIASVYNQKINPLFSIYPVILKENIKKSIAVRELKMTDFILKNEHVLLPFQNESSGKIFKNINTEKERKEAEKKWKN
ncbi:molybdenum cofactor guanylyltransferase [Salegentibacter sp. JZCK2]|uniref:molybdenum cofactor guanylyltransferase n=1 Tax=Salegentibacter tibetensis TaxID=2873600 RepID=UPI001CC98DFB|nr:molybdenum cofactor guanylyltransferase [Salegentibacter tibetensis]MBZ9728377.1 molybdenum cofactor guanylyltransferase [Salegentibacter tibetensis]